MPAEDAYHRHGGFTLIELSIVLVIIGLIVGGVLVGQDLMRAAAERAQITQIEKFNQAVNTFRGKYGYLPGDVPFTAATQFGLVTQFDSIVRGNGPGVGDGNGIIEGICDPAPTTTAGVNGMQQVGETAFAWTDLSTTNLIEGQYTGDETLYAYGGYTPTQLTQILPPAKISANNFVYIYSYNGIMYWGVSAIYQVLWGQSPYSHTTITVRQAYDIDSKTDDGFPQTGSVMARAAITGSEPYPDWGTGAADTSATPASSATCYDNGGVAGQQKYSMTTSNGNNANCALSFQFQ